MEALMCPGKAYRQSTGRKVNEFGFTYITILIGVAILSVSLTVTSEVWVKISERQKLQQQEWIGRQYVQAIESYYNSSPGTIKRYPPDLQSLLLDNRFLNTKRHLRELYSDPLSNLKNWEILSGEGGVVGVKSTVNGHIFVATIGFAAGSIVGPEKLLHAAANGAWLVRSPIDRSCRASMTCRQQFVAVY